MKTLILALALSTASPSHAAENEVVNMLPINEASIGPVVFENEETKCRYVGVLQQAASPNAWIVSIKKSICQQGPDFKTEPSNLAVAIGTLPKPARTHFGIYPRTKPLPNGAPMVDGTPIAMQISTALAQCAKATGKPCDSASK